MILKRGKKFGARVYDPSSGTNVWLGTFDTRREAKEAETEGLSALKRGTLRRSPTVAEFAETWVDRFPRPKETTNRYYREQIGRFVRQFGNAKMASIDRRVARDWALENPAQVKVVRAMFNDAIRDEAIDRNPFENLRLPGQKGNRDLIVPTDDEVDRLIHCAGDVFGEYGRLVYGNMIQFAAYSGLRLGEIAGLRWSDVDVNAGTIHVERQWSIRLGKFTSPKSGRSRTVILTERAREAYESVPRVHEEMFRSTNGARFTGSLSQHYWNPVRAAAQMSGFPFHGLRHFFGTHLARHGVGPIQIAAMMGHNDGGKLAMTLYIHMTEQDTLSMVAAALGHAGPKGVVVPVTDRSQREAGSA